MRLPVFLGLGAAALAIGATRAPALLVTGAWTRPTVIAGLNAAGYLTLVNQGAQEARLIGATSPAAASVTLHRSAKVGGMMTMRAVAFIPIPAHGRASLSPGGFHLMLEHVKRPLSIGQTVPISLRFAGGETVRATLTVRASAGVMPGMAM